MYGSCVINLSIHKHPRASVAANVACYLCLTEHFVLITIAACLNSSAVRENANKDTNDLYVKARVLHESTS